MVSRALNLPRRIQCGMGYLRNTHRCTPDCKEGVRALDCQQCQHNEPCHPAESRGCQHTHEGQDSEASKGDELERQLEPVVAAGIGTQTEGSRCEAVSDSTQRSKVLGWDACHLASHANQLKAVGNRHLQLEAMQGSTQPGLLARQHS